MFDNNFNDFKRAIFIIHNIDKELLRSCLDIEDILHVTLTGITAGYFLGFSRAFILLYEEDNKVLSGKKGIGPFDIEEANLIWQKIGDGIPIEKLFENGKRAELKNSRFNLSVEKIKINVEELPEEDYIKKVIKEKRIQVLYNVDKNNVKLPEQIKFLLQPSDIVISPILAESSLIGIIFADNAFHRKPITEETLLFLSLISIHTALSLEIAIKYNEIKRIQKELLE
ncbi:MAG: hypothetical protein NZ891_00110, partial [bacterium]|nr:hypothetical protein [bacterium]MDW8163137.1 hypothetical protein [Candidatus Omnitrophota bacterium]